MRLVWALVAVLPASHAMAADCHSLLELLDTNTCLAAELKDLQRQIADQQDEIVLRFDKSGDPEAGQAFLNGQTAWEAFTAAECEFQSFGIGSGSSRALVSLTCHIGMARARIADLDGYLSCDEGDLACRVPRD